MTPDELAVLKRDLQLLADDLMTAALELDGAAGLAEVRDIAEGLMRRLCLVADELRQKAEEPHLVVGMSHEWALARYLVRPAGMPQPQRRPADARRPSSRPTAAEAAAQRRPPRCACA